MNLELIEDELSLKLPSHSVSPDLLLESVENPDSSNKLNGTKLEFISNSTPLETIELSPQEQINPTISWNNSVATVQSPEPTAITLDVPVLEEDLIPQASTGINPAFDLIGLTELRNDSRFQGIDGSDLTVVVIDTGLDFTHPLLAPNYITGRDFVNNSQNPIDSLGHGTHVSGIVGAADESIGVANDVGLIALQVFEDNGSAQFSTIEDALEWVFDHREEYNIVAVNMSLGGGFYSSEAQVFGDIIIDDIQRLEQEGITVVSAAGNSYRNNEFQNLAAPAIYSTLAVGAVWQDDQNSNLNWSSGATDFSTDADRIVSFSQRLDAPNTIFAPGALINSTVPGGGLARQAGTSMASPMVAGAVALLQEAALEFGGRLLSTEEVVEILLDTADSIFDGDDEDDNVVNTNISYSRLNVYAAVVEVWNRFANVIDGNGTIAGAVAGPILDGSLIAPILGTIGVDGSSTEVGDTDVDLFRFELLVNSTVTIEVGENGDQPDDFDSFLRLFDDSGNELFVDDNRGEGDFSLLEILLEPGTYYVGVSGDNNRSYDPNLGGSGVAGATGNYALEFSIVNEDLNGSIGGAELVNLGNDLEPFFINEEIGTDRGDTVVGVSDVDLFEIVVPDNGVLLIDIDTPFSTNFVDSYLRLFDADGNQVFSPNNEPVVNDNGLAVDAEGNRIEFSRFFSSLVFNNLFDSQEDFVGHRSDSFLGGLVQRGDRYYIGISDAANSNYDPNDLSNRSLTGAGGAYNLTISFTNNDRNGSITQALVGLPLPIVAQSETIGVDEDLEVGDRDVDFLKINSQIGGILEIDIDSYGETSITDPVNSIVLFFDENGNLLASDDDSDSFDPLLQYEIEANQDYFVAVTGSGNHNFDPFQLGSGSGGDTGDYIFSSSLLPLEQISQLTNDSINTQGIVDVAVGDEIFAHIGKDNSFVVGPEDIDLYRFLPETSGMLEIRTSTNEEFSADTFLRFFDENGVEIAANDNENENTRSSFLAVEVIAGQEYYIGVNGFSPGADNYNPLTGEGAIGGSQGDYTLSLTQNNPPDLAITSFTVGADTVRPHNLRPYDGSTSVNFTLLNQGEATAGAFEVKIVYSDDPIIDSEDEVVATLSYNQGLEPMASESQTLQIELPLDLLASRADHEDPAGLGVDYQSQHRDYLGAIIDSEQLVGESNEDNNTSFDHITYFPWDLDESGVVTPADVIFVLNRLGETRREENAQADFDLDNSISSRDAFAVIERLGYAINSSVIESF